MPEEHIGKERTCDTCGHQNRPDEEYGLGSPCRSCDRNPKSPGRHGSDHHLFKGANAWQEVQPPHTDRVIEGCIHKYARDLVGDLISIDALEKRMPEIALNSAITYKHGRDPQRGAFTLGRICAWRRVGDEIQIKAAINRGNDVVDAIWREEIVPMGTRAGFSIGGCSKWTDKVCRMERGKQTCDIADVTVGEVAWTPNPCNQGARLHGVNFMAKEDEQKVEKFAGAAATLAMAAVQAVGSAGGSEKVQGGAKGKIGEDEEQKALSPERAAQNAENKRRYEEARAAQRAEDSKPRCGHTGASGHKCSAAHGHGGLHRATAQETGDYYREWKDDGVEKELDEKSLTEKYEGDKMGPDPDSRFTSSDDPEEKKRLSRIKVPMQKCGCGKDGCGKCKSEKEEKELAINQSESTLKGRLTEMYRRVPDKAQAEVAVLGCGTCDDYVTLLIRERGLSATQAVVKLQGVLDGAYDLYQKAHEEPEKLPKETDGDKPMDEKKEKELLDKMAALEKAVADLKVQKESAGFKGDGVGQGQPPLQGVPTSAPEGIDMVNMSSTKSEVFAKDEKEAVVKLIKSGYQVVGYQKAAPDNVPPKAPGSPAGVEKNIVQKMRDSMTPEQRQVLGWAERNL
jgi:hypothetical protein